MTMETRDRFADLRQYPFSATGAFTGETEVNGAVIDLDGLPGSPQSIALSVVGIRTAGSPAGDGSVVVSANWQEADDSGFSSNVRDVPDHEVISAVSVAASGANGKFSARLALNLQQVSKRFVRAQVTVAANAADTHASTAQYLISGHQETPTAQVQADIS